VIVIPSRRVGDGVEELPSFTPAVTSAGSRIVEVGTEEAEEETSAVTLIPPARTSGVGFDMMLVLASAVTTAPPVTVGVGTEEAD
jgi:hypothetical protein